MSGPVDLIALQLALEGSWDEATTQASPSAPFTPERPSTGQCCVSSMVIQRYLGGEIVRGVTNEGGVHYWNELPGGAWYDSTRAQFAAGELIVEYVVRPDPQLYLFRDTLEKYALLAGRVEEQLRTRAGSPASSSTSV